MRDHNEVLTEVMNYIHGNMGKVHWTYDATYAIRDLKLDQGYYSTGTSAHPGEQSLICASNQVAGTHLPDFDIYVDSIFSIRMC